MLFRGGTLTMISVPDAEQEALRDLVRSREDAVEDLMRARNRLTKFLLRYGHRYRGRTTWSEDHWRWVRAIRFDLQHSQHALDVAILAVTDAEDRLRRIEVLVTAAAEEHKNVIAPLCALRGIDLLSALTVRCEMGSLKRFPTAPQFMAAVGLVPSESSSGGRQRRGSITKTGNAHVRRILIEAAWHARHRPNVSRRLRDRRAGLADPIVSIAKNADARLHRKFSRMLWRNKNSRSGSSMDVVVNRPDKHERRTLDPAIWHAPSDA